VWNLITILALAATAPANVTATKLDGTVVAGRLQDWSAEQIVISSASGRQTIAAADLLSVDFARLPTADSGQPIVELADGSHLPIAEFAVIGALAKARLQIPAPTESQNISIPLENVLAVRLQPLEPAVLPQWQEIRKLALPSDLIVVAKRGGKSLDHLECVLGEVTDKEVVCQLEGKEVQVPRAKVAGLIYYRAEHGPAAVPKALVSGSDGLRIAAQSFRWNDDTLEIKTGAGPRIAWPLANVASVDLSAGKLVVLSDLEPQSVKWQPLVVLPAAASLAAKFGQPHVNQSASGGQLTLTYPEPNSAVGTAQVKTFGKGLAIRSRSEIVYRLPAGYHRFLAEAGIDPAAAATGNVLLRILADDRLLIEQAIDGSDAPLPIDLDVTGVKRLKIVVDYGKNLDTGDWLNLCNLRIVK
jgi:NPCBM/NEW2 domain